MRLHTMSVIMSWLALRTHSGLALYFGNSLIDKTFTGLSQL
jgi:hypothetical protein